MKKLQVKGFVVGMLVMFLLMSVVTAFAAARSENINVTFSGIRLVVNGVPAIPRDGAGNEVEPFIWNGTTYLPVRGVANALGQDVRWDGSTQTVYINQRDAGYPTPTPSPIPTPTPAPTSSPDTESNPLVGRWEYVSGDMSYYFHMGFDIEFFADGRVMEYAYDEPGKYTIIGESRMSAIGDWIRELYFFDFTIVGDILTITDSDGDAGIWRRR
jgi:hypothetical protein